MVVRLNVRFSGTLGTPEVENWSVGLHYGGGGGVPTQTETQALSDSIATAVSASSFAALGSLKNGDSSAFRMTQVDLYAYGNAPQAVAHGITRFTTPYAGTGTVAAPAQSSSVITMLTALPGRSYRGRIYWPCLAPGMASTLKASNPLGHASGLKSLNAAVEAALAIDGPWVLSVYSAKNDVVTPVTSFRSGDVVDTQRRRRDSLSEVFTSVAK